MRTLAIIALACMVLASCNTEQKPKSDLVIEAIQNEFGPFDVKQQITEHASMYAYTRKVYERTGRTKDIIDKAMNLVGTDRGSYTTWKTPNEEIELSIQTVDSSIRMVLHVNKK